MSDLSAIVWAYGTEADLSRRSLAAKGSLLCVNFYFTLSWLGSADPGIASHEYRQPRRDLL